MITHPYQIIKKRLLDEVPELQQCDYDLGHGYDSEKLLYAPPAALISFPPMETNTNGGKMQTSKTYVMVRLITSALTDGDERIDNQTPDSHMAIMNKIFGALQGFSSSLSFLGQFEDLAGTTQDYNVFTGLQRTRVEPDNRPQGIMTTIQHFSCMIFDTSLIKPKQAIDQDLIITKEIVI